MARPRPLRHKLMLGLTLVVGSVLLLLGGTLYGINAYLSTVKTTEAKVVEIKYVTIAISYLKGTEPGAEPDITAEYAALRQQSQLTRQYLEVYRAFNEENVARGLDPDNGQQEKDHVRYMSAALDELDNALAAVKTQSNAGPSESVRDNTAVRNAFEKTRRAGEFLRLAVIDDIDRSIRRANASIRQSCWVVGTATMWTFLMIAALMYYFRQWMYAPIRELQAGVVRVHSGDFTHPIQLHTRDELEELADEFNAMTERVSATYADLARQVNDRSRQLVRSERMVSVGFLAAGVAHEINNPLASILFCSEALERRVEDVLNGAAGRGIDPADTDVLTRYLKMIQQESLRCKDITQKLLDFSRTGERAREATDLGVLVRGVLEVARHLPNCRAKSIVFEPAAVVIAPVNAQDLKSVILNLVVNALDSMEDGGRLTISLTTGPEMAEIAFADTGCGMAPDVLQNIFEPFYTRSRTGKGTGLGLFISHQIIDQHGGGIEAASAGPGRGSTFTVRLPLKPVLAGEAGPAQPEATILAFPGQKNAA